MNTILSTLLRVIATAMVDALFSAVKEWRRERRLVEQGKQEARHAGEVAAREAQRRADGVPAPSRDLVLDRLRNGEF